MMGKGEQLRERLLEGWATATGNRWVLGDAWIGGGAAWQPGNVE